MPANSSVRRAAKRVLAPLVSQSLYRRLQAVSMARDIRSGAFAEPELELIPLLVQPGDTVVDLGANYGMWTYPLSRAVGVSGAVWAFEPIPFTVGTLRDVVRMLRLKNVSVVAKGAGAQAGSLEFEVPLQDNGAISGGQAHAAVRNDERPGRELHDRWPNSARITCEVVSLDDALRPDGPLSLIKADIEGAELWALQGAKRLLDAHHPTVICEVNPWFLEGFCIEADELRSFFSTRGYRGYRYSDGKLQIANEFEEDNYVFVHSSRMADLAALLQQPVPS